MSPFHFNTDPGPDNVRRDLASRLASSTSADDLVVLIASPNIQYAAASIAALGAVGERFHAAVLQPLLRDSRPVIHRAAEDAIWAIWMRSGTAEGNSDLARAIDEIRDGALAGAFTRLTALVQREPEFAEAHHQRGVVAFLLDQVETASSCFSAALNVERAHFGAMAGLGHAAAAMEDWDGARRAYESVLRIHPRLEGIAEALAMINAGGERAELARSAGGQ